MDNNKWLVTLLLCLFLIPKKKSLNKDSMRFSSSSSSGKPNFIRCIFFNQFFEFILSINELIFSLEIIRPLICSKFSKLILFNKIELNSSEG